MSGSPVKSALFRDEVVARQNDGEVGETMRIVPLSHYSFTLFLVVILMVAGAYLGTASYSRKEAVDGVLVTTPGIARVMVPRPGNISELLVKEGDLVKADQVLFKVVAEETTVSGTGADTAILEAMKQQAAILKDQIANEEAHAKAEVAQLDDQIASHNEEIARLKTQRELQARRADAARAFVTRITPFKEKGVITAFEFANREQAALTEEQNLASIEERISTKKGELNQAKLNRKRLPIDGADRLATLRRQVSDLAQHQTEIEGRRRYLVRAPMAGRVTNLLAALGASVEPRLPQLSIVPVDSRFEAELYVPARAIGFVKPGQHVRLRFDAFPYQRFGAYGGTIAQVANSMARPGELLTPVTLKEPAYRIKVALDRQTIDAFGREVPLEPDMTVHADIVLDQRSMLQWLLEPLLAARHQFS